MKSGLMVGDRIIVPANVTAIDGDTIYADTVAGASKLRLHLKPDHFEIWDNWLAELKAELKSPPQPAKEKK